MLGLTGRAYCEHCNLYMKRRSKRLLYADVSARKVPRKDSEAQSEYESERAAAMELALEQLNQAVALLSEERCDEALAHLEALPEVKDDAKIPRKVTIDMHHCALCDNFHVQAALMQVNGSDVTTNKLFEWQRKA